MRGLFDAREETFLLSFLGIACKPKAQSQHFPTHSLAALEERQHRRRCFYRARMCKGALLLFLKIACAVGDKLGLATEGILHV